MCEGEELYMCGKELGSMDMLQRSVTRLGKARQGRCNVVCVCVCV